MNQTELALRFLVEVTRAANEPATLEGALGGALGALRTLTGFELGQVWRPTPDGAALRCDAAAYAAASPARMERFRRASLELVLRRGEGLPGQCWARGSPLWLATGQQPSFTPRVAEGRAAGLRSGFAFPVHAGGQLLAILELLTGQQSEPPFDLEGVLEPLAAHLGIVFENKRTIAELDRRSREVASLQRIAEVTLGCQGLDLSLQEMAERISQATGMPIVSIALHDEPRDLLLFKGVAGVAPEQLPREARVDATLAGVALRAGQPLHFRKASEDARLFPSLRALGMDTFVAAPIVLERQSLGVLTLASREALGEQMLSWVATLAHQVATVIQRKRAEERQSRLALELAEAALEWEETFNSLDAAMLRCDGEGRVRRLNRAARGNLPTGAPEPLGRLLAELGTGEPWRTLGTAIARAHASGEPVYASLREAENGRAWELRVLPAPGDASRGTTVVAVDVTRVVELGESIKRAETLAAMGALVAGVAHEVRNPLFGISATLDAFEERHRGRAESEPFLAALRRELDRLNLLMADLLEYGRPAREHEHRPGALAAVVAEACWQSAALAERRGVRIDARTPDALPLVRMAPERLVQVLQNVLSNALHLSPKGGVVSVRARLQREAGRDWVACEVLDGGPGFKDEELRRAFEPFFTRRRGGTGLGLSLVQRIVAEHGGQVALSNREGGGACVLLRFPALPEAPRAASPAHPVPRGADENPDHR